MALNQRPFDAAIDRLGGFGFTDVHQLELVVASLLGFLTILIYVCWGRQINSILFRTRQLLCDRGLDVRPEDHYDDDILPKVRLMIDGCNGPLRLDRTSLCSGNERSLPQVISLLHVVDGENKDDRIWLLPALQAFLSAQKAINWSAEIFFDGIGLKQMKDANLMQGKWWRLSSRIILHITDKYDEVDNVFVEEVEYVASTSTSRVTEIPLSEVQQLLVDDAKSPKCNSYFALTYWRNELGCGKSRKLARMYQLMRPDSVFCSFSTAASRQPLQGEMKAMSKMRNLIKAHILKSELDGVGETSIIVVTDDIFLRQRVARAGGLVMTFEQLWDLLITFAINCP